MEMSNLNIAILDGEKYLFKNLSVKSSQVVMDSVRKEFNQLFALSSVKMGTD